MDGSHVLLLYCRCAIETTQEALAGANETSDQKE